MTWRTIPFGTAADIVMGQSPPGDTYNTSGDGLPFFQGKAEFGERYPAVRKWCNAPLKVARAGDMLLSVRAPVGPTNIANEDCCIGRGLAAIRARPELAEQSFLRHFLKYCERDLARRGQGSTFHAVNRSDIAGLSLPLPAPSEQRRIVELLDQADALRHLRAKADAKADRILRALFLKTFGDPATNPKGWKQRRIGELGTVATGNTPSRKVHEYYGDDIEWIKSDNINTPSHFLTRATEGLSEAGRRVGRTTPKRSTLVTCIAGSPECIGNAAMAEREVAFNQQINAVAPHPSIDPFFLYAHFVVGKRLVQSASTGAMKGMVSKGRFSSILFLDPPPERQAKFGAQCAALCERIEAQRRAGLMLESLFAMLLQRAFSGALTSPWRQVHMKELIKEMEQQARYLVAPPPPEVRA